MSTADNTTKQPFMALYELAMALSTITRSGMTVQTTNDNDGGALLIRIHGAMMAECADGMTVLSKRPESTKTAG